MKQPITMICATRKIQDRKTRNEVCDREMLKELHQITNLFLRKRLQRSLVSNMINAKVKKAEKSQIDLSVSRRISQTSR